MKKLALTALALALTATPALARCHGHRAPDGQWYLDVYSWTNAEMAEIGTIADRIKAIDPTSTSSSAEIAGMLDQFECAGVAHDIAINNILGLALSQAALKGKPQQEPPLLLEDRKRAFEEARALGFVTGSWEAAELKRAWEEERGLNIGTSWEDQLRDYKAYAARKKPEGK